MEMDSSIQQEYPHTHNLIKRKESFVHRAILTARTLFGSHHKNLPFKTVQNTRESEKFVRTFV